MIGHDESFYDHDDSLEEIEVEEWEPGTCDNCYGQTVQGPLGPIHCACAIGQGADDGACTCGPPYEAQEPLPSAVPQRSAAEL